ncbi:MAG: queuosine precursor transporter [Alphaproteobacteria bacterium]|jgi:hypothetical protein|nr:queuosine precursor transporter [Candidatus Jidaibacter sp.]
MDDAVIRSLIYLTQNVGSEALSGFLFIFCYIVLLTLWRLFEENGLYLYTILAVVIANIQVLKTTTFAFSTEPVALGTIVFATIFTATDILTEHKGVEVAKTCVKLSFAAQLLMTLFMVITLIHPTDSDFMGKDDDGAIINPVQFAMYTLFAPSVRILIASLSSYYISQFFDIWLFKLIKDYTHKRLLWLRFNASTLISGLLDNIIFSTLAWVVLSPTPVTFNALIFTYIFGTYGSRVLVTLTSTPIMYMSYWLKKDDTK